MTENTTESTEETRTNQHPLAAKITSDEALEAILEGNESSIRGYDGEQQYGVYSPLMRSPSALVEDSDEFGYQGPNIQDWWLRREMYREANGVYEKPTEVLMGVRKSYGVIHMFPHMSTKVPGEIAYTPSRRDGEADRQVRTTLGKFLAKFCPLLTDKAIAAIVSAHIAELDDTFHLATTPEEIERVYRTMRGDTGCMRYSKEHFDTPLHPSAAYAYEGLGVAYLTDGNGDVTARSVVYVNPKNPKDKRYVRIYGVRTLGRKLERSGYRNDGLGGAKLRFIEHGKYAVVPYLDPAGGANSGVPAEYNGAYVIGFKGDDFLTVLTDEMVARAQDAGMSVMTGRHSSALSPLLLNDKRVLETKACALTGKQVDVLLDDVVRIYRSHEAGVEIADRQAANREGYTLQATRYVTVSGRSGDGQIVWLKGKEFYDGGYLDDDDTWSYRGYGVLDPQVYPDLKGKSRLVYKGSAVVTRNEGDRSYYAHPHDCSRMVDETGGSRMVHKSQIPAGAVSIVPMEDSEQPTFTPPDNPNLVKTMGGKWAVPGFSHVFLHSSGKYCAPSTGSGRNAFNVSFRVANPEVYSDKFFEMLAKRITESSFGEVTSPAEGEMAGDRYTEYLAYYAGRSVLGFNAPIANSGSGITTRSNWYDYTTENMVKAYTRLKELKERGLPLGATEAQAKAYEFWLRVMDHFMPAVMLRPDAQRYAAAAKLPPVEAAPSEAPAAQPPTEPAMATTVTNAAAQQANADDVLLNQLINARMAATVADREFQGVTVQLTRPGLAPTMPTGIYTDAI